MSTAISNVSWNTGHGWTRWHKEVTPNQTKCCQTVPGNVRVSHVRPTEQAPADACEACWTPVLVPPPAPAFSQN